jgi:tumor protein p53-inducible protein 3
MNLSSDEAEAITATDTMKYVAVDDHHNLHIGSIARPEIKSGTLLIKVHAFGINRADISQRQGNYPPPPGASHILGLECAGEVIEINEEKNSNAHSFGVGSRVMALVTGGAYAEYCVADISCCLPISESLSYSEAAAIMENYITAYQGIREIAQVQAGELVLIHAGAAGVGTAAVQLVKNVFSAVPITTSSAGKLNHCRNHGAAAAVDYQKGSWASEVIDFAQKSYNKSGVDIIFDPIGASYYEDNVRSIGLDGRWVIYATMGGKEINNFDLGQLMKKRIQLTGTTLRNRGAEYKAKLIADFAASALPAIHNRIIRPHVDRVFNFAEIAEAHKYMERNQSTGKIVVQILK